MLVFTSRRRLPLMAPEPGDDSGGSAGGYGTISTPDLSGQSLTPPVEPTTSVEGGTPPDSSGQDMDLRAALKAGADKMRDKGRPKDENGKPIERTPGETPLHDAAALAAEVTGDPAKPPEGEADPALKTVESDEAGKTDESAPTDQPTADPAPIKIGEVDYTPAELGEIVDYAKKANEYFQKSQVEFDKRMETLTSREAKIEERSSSPDMVILNALAENPDLRDKFLEFAREVNPELVDEFNQEKHVKTVESLEKKVKDLEARLENNDKQAVTRTEEGKKAEVQAKIDQFVRDVHTFRDATAKEFGLDAEVAEMIENDASVRVQTGRIKPDVESVKTYMRTQMEKIGGTAKAAADKAAALAARGYVADKNKLPPPPPIGGGPARLGVKPPKDFKEAGRNLTRRLEALEKP